MSAFVHSHCSQKWRKKCVVFTVHTAFHFLYICLGCFQKTAGGVTSIGRGQGCAILKFMKANPKI